MYWARQELLDFFRSNGMNVAEILDNWETKDIMPSQSWSPNIADIYVVKKNSN